MLPVTTLSIPGTHNSCVVDGHLGLAKTQNLDLADQLNAGIRFFDIRFAHYNDNLCVHHDVVCTEKSYADAVPPGSNSVATSPAFTSETRLGEIRGKIVLLRRFEASPEVGLDLTYWPENQRFRSASAPFYDVEDRYQDPGDDDKFNFVISHIEDARRGDPKDLYITFSSAVDLTARGYSKAIYPRLNDYLAQSP